MLLQFLVFKLFNILCEISGVTEPRFLYGGEKSIFDRKFPHVETWLATSNSEVPRYKFPRSKFSRVISSKISVPSVLRSNLPCYKFSLVISSPI